MLDGTTNETLNVPLFNPVEFAAIGPKALLLTLIVTAWGGTQFCPLNVTVPCGDTEVGETEIAGGLDARTVKGPSS